VKVSAPSRVRTGAFKHFKKDAGVGCTSIQSTTEFITLATGAKRFLRRKPGALVTSQAQGPADALCQNGSGSSYLFPHDRFNIFLFRWMAEKAQADVKPDFIR